MIVRGHEFVGDCNISLWILRQVARNLQTCGLFLCQYGVMATSTSKGCRSFLLNSKALLSSILSAGYIPICAGCHVKFDKENGHERKQQYS
jgi:hypothetical protein